MRHGAALVVSHADTLVGTHASEFDGTIRPSPKALLVVLARTEPKSGTIR
jgi:hypothetical protein